MNQRVKFLELVLSDLVSERDTLEMDLNFILNNEEKKTKNKKKEFNNVLKGIVNVNNKIKTLSEYITILTPQEEFVNNNKDSQ
tara:strand:- start:461 stop:709 length:249 start_codon:yes stop_codon:yes gene_type:complete